MNEPIKKGDLCVIINGYNGEQSPNIGKIVTVGNIAIEHPLFGAMVEIHGVDLIIENRPSGGKCNIPKKWLKKIDPPKQASPSPAKEVTA